MKTFSIVIFLALSLPAFTQLTNGSFEINGAFSLQGWEWTCNDPEAIMEAPIGGGVWSAAKESGHAKGCFPSYLYQRLPNAQNGELYTISGWVKCGAPDSLSFCLISQFGLGRVNAGVFTLEEATGSSTTQWTFASITDTIELQAGDTAIVVLNSGFIGGPFNPVPGWFDDFTLSGALGISESPEVLVSLYPDPVDEQLNIGSTALIRHVEIFDGAGRCVYRNDHRNGTVRVDTSELKSGMHVIRVLTATGVITKRFVKR